MGSNIIPLQGLDTSSASLGVGSWRGERIIELIKDSKETKSTEFCYQSLYLALTNLFYPEEIRSICTRKFNSKEKGQPKKKFNIFRLFLGTASQLDNAINKPFAEGGIVLNKTNLKMKGAIKNFYCKHFVQSEHAVISKQIEKQKDLFHLITMGRSQKSKSSKRSFQEDQVISALPFKFHSMGSFVSWLAVSDTTDGKSI